MKINNISSSPNFGSLRLEKGCESFLQKQSVETLEELGKVGKEIKDFKHWNLKVTKDGYILAPDSKSNHIALKEPLKLISYGHDKPTIEAKYSIDSMKKERKALVAIDNSVMGKASLNNFVNRFNNTKNPLQKVVKALSLLEKHDTVIAERAAYAQKKENLLTSLLKNFGE